MVDTFISWYEIPVKGKSYYLETFYFYYPLLKDTFFLVLSTFRGLNKIYYFSVDSIRNKFPRFDEKSSDLEESNVSNCPVRAIIKRVAFLVAFLVATTGQFCLTACDVMSY